MIPLDTGTLISLGIQIVQTVLSQLKNTNAEQQAIADVQAALDALLKVQGSDVTYSQLESLRVNKTF